MPCSTISADAHIAAALHRVDVKGETVDELAGLAEGMARTSVRGHTTITQVSLTRTARARVA